MAITHSPSVRTLIATTILNAIDNGSAPGKCLILAANNTLLATIPLEQPCGLATNATLTLVVTAAQQDASIDATGSAAKFIIQDGDDNDIFYGDVTSTGGGGDMTVSSTAFTQGSPVNLTSGSYTAMP